MTVFTMPLYEVIEFTGGELTVENGMSKMIGGDIGLNDYAIFDSAHRDTLNGMIIDHFLTREIGLETIDMFVHKMRTKMNTIMPFYNGLFESQKIQFDPLSTIDLTTIGSNDMAQSVAREGEASALTDTSAKSRSVASDTPQQLLSGDKDYATNAVDANNQSNGENLTNENSSEEVDVSSNSQTTVKGYQGVPSDLIMRYRESLINVNLSIINEIEADGLFMLVYDNGDSFTRDTMRGYLL